MRHASPSITRIEAAIDLADEMAAEWRDRAWWLAVTCEEQAAYARAVEREAADTAKLRRHRLLAMTGGVGA